VGDSPFNLGLARNVAALFALQERRYDYLVFHDVDMIPVSGVDYGFRESQIVWFMNAGTCKVHKRGRQVDGWHLHHLSERHRRIIHFLVRMPLSMKEEYVSLHGLNWVDTTRVEVVRSDPRVCHLRYRWFDVVS
jgi:hypothetical protein